MDQNEKFLKKLSPAERDKILSALRKIARGDVVGMDIKKLTGHQDVFRARVGSIRIIFLANRNGTTVLNIARRDDTTYRDF